MTHLVALDPKRSVVVEACAGSGKTWLLVSRIVRLLLDGAKPSQILAITFTRKAAQEMQARLQQWLRELALGDEAYVRKFFAERGLPDLNERQLQRARELYDEVLLAQPPITISTFHGWFIQILRRAPLNAGVMQGMTLLEHASSVQEEAWEELLEKLRQQPDSDTARHLQWLFETCGLFNTRKLVFNFLAKRAEWWAFTQAAQDALNFALEKLRCDLAVDLDVDPAADWGRRGSSEAEYFAFVRQLAKNGTDAQQSKARELECAWSETLPEARFGKIWPLLFTQKHEPRKGRPFAPTKKQDEASFLASLAALQSSLQSVRDILVEQQAFRLNEAVLSCGVALLEHYQALKAQKQQMDFSDLEWQLYRLLQQSEHAETMQYKLDCRYRHVLLDEFQDTNPLQWQILRAWFDAAVAVESQPTVFLVGDPKQSIYRFRRAEARLFGVAREYLVQHFNACVPTDFRGNTRRNAQAIVDAVNAVFREQPDGFEFVEHQTQQKELPGHVWVLPLAELPPPPAEEAGAPETFTLRNPLTTPRAERAESARYREAEQFARLLGALVSGWKVNVDGTERCARWGDIMVLVRNRTHLAIYEEALRRFQIPYISSRRGGLLDTLEAEDIQALLTFLITPFADLALAKVLRSPLFACSDEDLMSLGIWNGDLDLGGELPAKVATTSDRNADLANPPLPPPPSSWWQRLQQLATPSPALQRALTLLKNWLALADKLPVHDLLDRIYFEGEVIARYRAVLPPALHAQATANLHALMELALAVDAGRYPSLPRFLQELRELRKSEDDAPNEGRLGNVGDAVRIYTVHEAKGLEAPVVWLLDANAENASQEGYDILLDWPPHEPRPLHFSCYADQASRGKKRLPRFERDAAAQAREEMNLLYVAMTRAQQVLIVSGSQSVKKGNSLTWYERIAAATGRQDCPLLQVESQKEATVAQATSQCELPAIVAVGQRAPRNTPQQQRGIWLHALLQHLTQGCTDKAELQQRLSIPRIEMETLWQQAHALLGAPHLARFFDATQYRVAYNEMPYINAQGEVKRIDRLVEFDDEIWILDYKLGETTETDRYRAQMMEYREAMQSAYAGRNIICALVFADGSLKTL